MKLSAFPAFLGRKVAGGAGTRGRQGAASSLFSPLHLQWGTQQVERAGSRAVPSSPWGLSPAGKFGSEEELLASRAFSHLFIWFFIYPVSTLQTGSGHLLCSRLQLENGDTVWTRELWSLSSWRHWHCTMKQSAFRRQEGNPLNVDRKGLIKRPSKLPGGLEKWAFG